MIIGNFVHIDALEHCQKDTSKYVLPFLDSRVPLPSMCVKLLVLSVSNMIKDSPRKFPVYLLSTPYITWFITLLPLFLLLSCFFFVVVAVYFWDIIFFCSTGCPGTEYVTHAGLKLMVILPPQSPKNWTWTTTSDLPYSLLLLSLKVRSLFGELILGEQEVRSVTKRNYSYILVVVSPDGSEYISGQMSSKITSGLFPLYQKLRHQDIHTCLLTKYLYPQNTLFTLWFWHHYFCGLF